MDASPAAIFADNGRGLEQKYRDVTDTLSKLTAPGGAVDASKHGFEANKTT